MRPTVRRVDPAALPHPLLRALAADRPPLSGRPDDVPGLLASAREHRMTGLLWSQVADGRIVLPKANTVELARTDLRTRAHHLRLWRTAAVVRDRLKERGIGVAMAKGVAAEARWYDRPGERPSKDIDMLLEPGVQHRLGDVFDALAPDRVLQGAAAGLLTSGVLQSVDCDINDVEVDLHVDIFKIGLPTRQADVLWGRVGEVAGPGDTHVDALDAELSFVHFLLHLTRDRFRFLLGFADVARILQREQLDWDFIERFVHDEGLDAMVYSALEAVVSALGLSYPPLPRALGVRARVWQRLWPPDMRLQPRAIGKAVPYRRQFYLALLARGRFIEGARWFVRSRLAPPSALLDLWHADVSGPYLVRLVRGRWLQRRVDQQRPAVPRTVGH